MTTTHDPTRRCLPLELILDIVDSLAEPLEPGAYAHSPAVLRTLVSLCLVSRTVSRVALRHLYYRIYFTSLAQMRAFFEMDRSHRLTRSLGFSYGIPISAIDTRHIWALYGGTVDRLTLEGQIQWFSTQSLFHTTDLQELALIPGGQRYPLEIWSTWTSFSSLRRMAFMHAVLHDHADNAGYYARLPELFPALEVLVMTLPARNKKQLACFDHLLSCLPSLKRAVIVQSASPARRHAVSLAQHDGNEVVEEMIGKKYQQRGVEIVEVVAAPECETAEHGEKRGFKEWFAAEVREGRIWTMRGVVWGSRESPSSEGSGGVAHRCPRP